jgi:predicted acylesterase/phospholipase RssA
MIYDLVFEGGGAKGMVFVGACEELAARQHSFGRLLGTSAGAITATLLAAGYSPAEMLEALAEKGEDGKSVFSTFMGQPHDFTAAELADCATRKLLNGVDLTFLPDFIENRARGLLIDALAANGSSRHLLALVERGGWYGADNFISWLKRKLSTGSRNGKPRAFSAMKLRQFFDATGVELSLVASDTSAGTILVLNHRTSPDCPLVWAVRMSMSIPLLWDEVCWKSEWGQYQSRDLTGNFIVDGGVLSNFPIELFISDEPQVTRLMGAKTQNNVLGLLIDEKLPVTKGLLVKSSVKLRDLTMIQRLERLVDTATGAHDKLVIEEYSHLVARLPAQGYGTTEFDMSDERRAALVAAGREAMKLYLDAGPGDGLTLPTKARGFTKPETAADRVARGVLAAQ